MLKSQTVILKNGEYLSTKFDKLPSGIINKTETGIGATTVELNANRNSIIVEPLKVTASTKAAQSKHSSLEILYVGSPTINHSKKTTDQDIEKFLLSKNLKFKKIIVVSDSLKRVIELLKKHKIDDYFLTIDESDTMQTDAIFRGSMESCYELYKEYPKENRCLVTATQIEFNDPDLAKEEVTNIEYENPVSRSITINYSENILGATLEKIKELHLKYPSEKIVVAYNNVIKLKDLAIDIEKELSLPVNDICILCGGSSKKTADIYFRELESTFLPAKINLITSAYHTGYDLKERYHLITIIDNTDPINCLSVSRIKQIAGRCRDLKGLFSENIIYNFKKPTETHNKFTLEDLVDAANKEIKAINCLTDNFGKSTILNDQILKIRKLITDDVTCLGYPLVSINSNGESQISYLNIDAAIETYRFYNETYIKEKGLFETLSKIGNSVTEVTLHTTTVVKPKTDFDLLKKERTSRIKQNLSDKDITELILLVKRTTDKIEKLAYDTFIEFSPYIENKALTERIVKEADNRKFSSLKNFNDSAKFSILDEKTSFKTAITSIFEIGKTYSDSEITESMNHVLKKLGLAIHSLDDSKAKLLFNLFIKSTRNTKHKPSTKKVINYNSTDLEIIKFSKEMPDLKTLFRL